MSALKRSGGRWSAVLGFAVLLAAFGVPAAAQFAPDPNSLLTHSQSIESETTFDLFENEFDMMLMPAYTGFFEDNGRYYTQLGNTGGTDMFQFAHYRPVGPGYLSFRIASSSEEFDSSSFSTFNDFDDDPANGLFDTPNIFDSTNSNDIEFRDMVAWVGYAWQLSDDGSLGFGLEWFESAFEQETSSTSDIDNRAGQGSPLSDDSTSSSSTESESSYQAITLVAEYMRRGDTSWRVRGFLQDVDQTVKSDFVSESETIFDNSDEEGIPPTRTTFSDIVRDRGGLGFDEGSFLSSVGYDGLRIGAEGDLRLEKNPKLHHQFNLGVSTASLDAKDDRLFDAQSVSTAIFDLGGGSELTQIFTNTSQESLTDDDITWTNWFATWKARWHRGDTHVGGGVYLFFDDFETEVSADTLDEFSITQDTDGTLDFEQRQSNTAFYTATVETEVTTITLPVALEQDVTDRIQVRLGAAYEIFMVTSEATTDFTDSDDISFIDTDGDGAGDPGTETVTEERQQDIFGSKDEDTLDDVVYNAGMAFEFDRVTLEVLFSGTSGGGSDREGIDLDQAYVGATFKLGAKK